MDRKLMFAATVLLTLTAGAVAGEVLYNGIELPDIWPPRVEKFDMPMPVPYLKTPPKVIPIDVGRQLFVDDFLVDSSTLKRTPHQAQYHPASPVIRPESGESGSAIPFSDGIWFDPKDQLFKAWYMSGGFTRYAVSRDGVRWEKPKLDVVPGTNVVVKHGLRDSNTVWLDQNEKDPQARFKMFCTEIKLQEGWKQWRLGYYTSADGIHWNGPMLYGSGVGDRTTVFYNPFRRVWVYSLRYGFLGQPHTVVGTGGEGRLRIYHEHPDAKAGLTWQRRDETIWVGADTFDPRHPVAKYAVPAQLYNLDGTPYESLMLGLFSVWEGPENDICRRDKIQKRNEVLVGFSRDGFHWQRPDRKPFAGTNETMGAWNWGNVQSVGGGCLVVGDKLYFYVSGRGLTGDPEWHGACSTGLAVIRRDGFVSMDADVQDGTLTTRPVTFRGKYLFVNLAAPRGELRVEALDDKGRPIEPFTLANCRPVQGDKTLLPVSWTGAADLSALAGRPVRFRFHLRNGSFYAFWVSPETSGASHGYVAAGGPGFHGPTDTVGMAGYGISHR